MSRKDLGKAALLGFLFALVFVPTDVFVAKHLASLTVWSLLILAPVGFMAALWIGYLLSKLRAFFLPLSKFGLVGLFNTGIDFAIFNGAIFVSGIEKGPAIIGFKSFSFLVALLNSYFWNKLWTFKKADSVSRKDEFLRYTVVTVIGFLLNIGITAFIVNYIPPMHGWPQVKWDNLAAVIATGASLLWNFVGYKLVVFHDGTSPVVL